MSVKQYTNSKGESLPKVICAVVDFENKRLGGINQNGLPDLAHAFDWTESNIFKGDNYLYWNEVDNSNFKNFYSIFPTCKNSRGQELPEEIQVEIVEERLRQGDRVKGIYIYDFEWLDSVKGNGYWKNIHFNSDYSTKSDDTFTQGEIVEVSDTESFIGSDIEEYVCFYKDMHIVYDCKNNIVYNCRHLRKIQPLELTIPELLTIAEEVKGTKVILKS